MPVKTKIPFQEGVYFITFTCYQWIPLIDLINGYDLVYKWFDYLKEQGHYIIGYQIMPNHLHAIIAFRNTGDDINNIIGNGKRFMAYSIVDRLRKSGRKGILTTLQKGVCSSDRKRHKYHQVWQDSFDWKECRNKKIICQKLEYMHSNANSGRWQLVENPADYPHSSAKYYITGEQGIYEVRNYMELDDVDLTKRATISDRR